MVVEIGTSATCRLLESLAARMATAIGDRFPRATVTVEVRKLNPPCPGHPQYTAARFTQAALRKPATH